MERAVAPIERQNTLVDGGAKEICPLPLDRDYLFGLFRELFEEHWQELTWGSLIPDAARGVALGMAAVATVFAACGIVARSGLRGEIVRIAPDQREAVRAQRRDPRRPHAALSRPRPSRRAGRAARTDDGARMNPSVRREIERLEREISQLRRALAEQRIQSGQHRYDLREVAR